MDGLWLDTVRIALGGRRLVGIDARIAPGETVTVMGPSGSGKSTLLSYVAGFLDPAFTASGRVLCGEIEISRLPAEERRAGILFQDPLLFPHMSVGGNLAFALPRAVRGRAARAAAVAAALADVELTGLTDQDPSTLSGGQMARVALARVLLSEPALLLLDEPFSRLDQPLRARTRELVFGAIRARALPAILVTHDEADAHAAGGPVVSVGDD